MKKMFYLILGIILIYNLNVNALDECTDYLTFVTTKDTYAHFDCMTSNPSKKPLKAGAEFKVCYQAGSDSIYKFNDGTVFCGIDNNTYKLKEPFDIKNAHPMEKTDWVVYDKDVDVYSDPSPIVKINSIKANTKVKATYYYGPYIYVNSDEITGWIYNEYISEIEPSYDDNTNTSESDTTTGKEESNTGTILIIICVIVLVFGLGYIIFSSKNKNNTEIKM